MGRLRCRTNAIKTVNGVDLGQPAIGDEDGNPIQKGDSITEMYFIFEDARLPNGLLNADGTITVDEPEL